MTEYVPSKVPCPACGTEMQEEMHCCHELFRFEDSDKIVCDDATGLKCPGCHTEMVVPAKKYPINR